MPKVNIDEKISAGALELVLGGKEYRVCDIPMSTMKKVEKLAPQPGEDENKVDWEDSIRGQLALMLGIDVKELIDIGVRAATETLSAIHSYLSAEQSPSK